jgi:hypothetical protein
MLTGWPSAAQARRGLEAVRAERDLDDHVLVDGADGDALGDHPVGIVLRDDLGGRGSPDDLGDALDRVTGVAFGLGEERRVGGRAGEHAPTGDLLDLGNGSGVDEQLHAG